MSGVGGVGGAVEEALSGGDGGADVVWPASGVAVVGVRGSEEAGAGARVPAGDCGHEGRPLVVVEGEAVGEGADGVG